MDFLELVSAARTCRRYHEETPLPAGTLEWLVSCARVTPSARNQQALRFATVEQTETRSALFPALKWAAALKEWDGPEDGERPTGYIVLLAETGKRDHFISIDMGITAQTMQLAAQTRNIGCCIFMSFDPRLVRTVLSIPEELEPVMVLAFGIQKEERRIVPMPEGKHVPYWRDPEGIHLVPKRSLDALLIIRN